MMRSIFPILIFAFAGQAYAMEYEILSDTRLHKIKRSVDVRIPERVDEAVLESIARRIKQDNEIQFTRTFIVYYLPGMKVNAGGWATSHFDPNLKVQILGRKKGTGAILLLGIDVMPGLSKADRDGFCNKAEPDNTIVKSIEAYDFMESSVVVNDLWKDTYLEHMRACYSIERFIDASGKLFAEYSFFGGWKRM